VSLSRFDRYIGLSAWCTAWRQARPFKIRTDGGRSRVLDPSVFSVFYTVTLLQITYIVAKPYVPVLV